MPPKQFSALDHVVRPCACPWCGHTMNAATGYGDNIPPNEGDFSVCISCGSVLRFGRGMRFEAVRDADWRASECAGDIELIRRAVLSIDRRRMK